MNNNQSGMNSANNQINSNNFNQGEIYNQSQQSSNMVNISNSVC